MTDLSNTLSFNLRVTGIDNLSFNSQTQQNVKKPVGQILYLETVPEDAIKLSYVGSDELSSLEDLYIGDRSDELYGNSRTNSIDEFLSYVSPINVSNRNFLVTQVFNEADSGDIPLYYKYIFEEDYSDIIAESVRVFDKDLNEVSTDRYKLVLKYNYNEDTGAKGDPSHYELYNSLKGEYDYRTAEYEVYYLQYTSNESGTEVVYTKLLENEVAYKIATEDDIWFATLSIKPWVDVYTIDETANNITVSMPKNTQSSVLYDEKKRIRVLNPVQQSDEYPWYLRVSNGNFNSGFQGFNISYNIPEFSEQAFNPIEPYKLAANILSQKIHNNLIKLPNENIVLGSLFSKIYVVVNDKDDNPLYAITNNEIYNDTDYLDFEGNRAYDSDNNIIKWSNSLFLGIDKLSGIVNVDVDLLDSYSIYSTYSYEEDTYTINSINMNSIFDSDVVNEIRAVYLVPKNCPTNPLASAQSESIRWLKISQSGKILDTNQNGIGGNENIKLDTKLSSTEGNSLTGVIGLHYSWRASTKSSELQEVDYGTVLNVVSTSGFPRTGWLRFIDDSVLSVSNTGVYRYVYYEEKTDTSFILSSTELEVPITSNTINISEDQTIELVNFVDERTINSDRDYQSELSNRVNETDIPINASRYFVIGEVSLNPPHSVDQAVKIDVRENGGGIRKEKYDEAKYINPRVQWYSDNGTYDGQVTPGNAVIVIKLPVSIKKNFSEQQIKDIIESNIPYGTLPIIRYYGYQPKITSLEVVSGEEDTGFGLGPFGEYAFGG